jgi:hypothetical protein
VRARGDGEGCLLDQILDAAAAGSLRRSPTTGGVTLVVVGSGSVRQGFVPEDEITQKGAEAIVEEWRQEMRRIAPQIKDVP